MLAGTVCWTMAVTPSVDHLCVDGACLAGGRGLDVHPRLVDETPDCADVGDRRSHELERLLVVLARAQVGVGRDEDHAARSVLGKRDAAIEREAGRSRANGRVGPCAQLQQPQRVRPRVQIEAAMQRAFPGVAAIGRLELAQPGIANDLRGADAGYVDHPVVVGAAQDVLGIARGDRARRLVLRAVEDVAPYFVGVDREDLLAAGDVDVAAADEGLAVDERRGTQAQTCRQRDDRAAAAAAELRRGTLTVLFCVRAHSVTP